MLDIPVLQRLGVGRELPNKFKASLGCPPKNERVYKCVCVCVGEREKETGRGKGEGEQLEH